MLKIENLVVKYGNVTALHGISMDIGAHEVVALVGNNGAGKSTTLKSISGNAVGYLAMETIEVAKKCKDPEEFTAKIAGLCDCWEDWCEDGDDADTVPFSGTWSLKYNKKLSKGAKSMLLVVPSYAKELEV